MYLDLALWVAVMLGTPSSRFDIDGRPAGISYASAATAAQAHLFRGLNALGSGVGLHGLVQPGPVSTPDILPEGGKFIEATYNNPAGTVLTNCISRVAITDGRFHW